MGLTDVPWYSKFSGTFPPYNNDQHPQLVWKLPAGVTVANVGFRDGDPDPSNDWGASAAGGALTWDAPKSVGGQDYSTLFNFRFDANASPSAADGVIVRLRPTEVRDWTPTLRIVGPGMLTSAK